MVVLVFRLHILSGRLSHVDDRARESEASARADAPDLVAHYYLVSVDPARDTPERLREYVAYFDPTFRGVTGERDEINKLAGAASVIYVIPESAPGVPYLVGHSSTITLIDPGGNVHAIFTSPLVADGIAADFAKIETHYSARR